LGVSTEAQSASVPREPERRGWDGEIISDIGRLGSAVNSELRRVLDVPQMTTHGVALIVRLAGCQLPFEHLHRLVQGSSGRDEPFSARR